MAFDLSGLTDYTDEHSLELIAKAVLKTNLMDFVEVRSGLTAGRTAINLLGGDLNVADSSCTWTASGDVIPTQVMIDVIAKEVKMDLCPDTLRTMWTSQLLNASANTESIGFEEVVTEFYIKKIANYNAAYLMAGDGTALGLTGQVITGDGANLAGGVQTASNAVNDTTGVTAGDTSITVDSTAGFPATGYLTFGVSDLVVEYTAVASGTSFTIVAAPSVAVMPLNNEVINYSNNGKWTPENAVEQALDLFDAIAPESKDRDDLVMIVSPTAYNALRRGLTALNYYNYDQADGTSLDLVGTNCKVIKSPGIPGNNAIAGPGKMIIVGVGLDSDAETISLDYAKSVDTVHFMAKWRIGVAVAEVNQFATNGLA